MSVTGEEGRAPVRPGIAIADEKAGLLATLGILAAYILLQKEGRGRQIDISMFDSLLLSFSFKVVDYYLTGKVPGPVGSYSTSAKRADYRCYPTKDGYIVIASGRGEDKWRALCKALGKEELARDPRFDSYDKRIDGEARVILEQIFEPIISIKTTQEWLTLLSAVDIPCAPVNTLDKAIQEAEAQGRGMIVSFPIPSGQMVTGVGNPLKVGIKENLNRPPRFGEHTKEVLTEVLNYSEERILELAKAKVIFLEG